jgi:VWFA-related protein
MSEFESCKRGTEPGGKTAGWLFALLFLVVAVSSGYGQSSPETQSAPAIPAQSPTISTNVDEVSLDLVVHDQKHKSVLDLKPEDIEVTDNDTPVALTGFHLVKADANTPHLITLVFDHFDISAAKSAQNLAVKILKMFPTNGYSFALLDFSGRLRLLQGFTEDRGAIAQAVKIVTNKADAPLILSATGLAVKNTNDHSDDERASAAAQAEKNLIAITRTGADLSGAHVDVKVRARYQTLLAALADAQLIRQDQHTVPTLAGLLALVRAQQKLTERKAIIYFTENAQMDSAAKEMVHTITGAANRAGVSFYVVDMDALDVGGEHQIQTAMLSGGAPFSPVAQPVAGSGGHATTMPMQQASGFGNSGSATDFMMRSDEGSTFTAVKSPMMDLANGTGGAYIDAQNNTRKPLQQMLQDMTTYYQASYVPPIKEYDGSFRTISTKPVRAGLEIKTKSGYVALAPGAEAGIRPFEVPLLKLLNNPQLPTDLKFHAAVLQFGELPDGNVNTLAVEVPITALETKKDTHTNLYSAHVSIVAQIKDKSGTVIEHFGEDISKRGALESIDTDASAAITLQRHFMAIPGQYVMEVVVFDQAGGKAGAERVNFEIPAVQPSPSLSEIVLVRKVDTFHEEDDPLEPLRFEKGRLTPNLSGQLPENSKSVSLFFFLHPDPKATDPATLEMEVSHNGNPGHRTPLSLPVRKEHAGDAIPYMANFKASALAPGVYDVKTTMTQGGKTSERDLTFTVEGTVAGNKPTAAADSALAADVKAQGVTAEPHAATQLVITTLSDPLPPPSPEEVTSLIADTRERAVGYADSLPNFICVEITNRSYDPTGSGRWKHRDTIAELLRYRDKAETHTMIEIDGKPSTGDRDAMSGSFSAGELGGVLKSVFAPSAKADFRWKETDALGAGTVQVFDYRVARTNSLFSVTGFNNRAVTVGFHGLVFIDSTTRNVRRITLVADDLPADFPTHATSLAVDYDYVVINAHDYLMPISAEMSLRQGRHEAVLNTIEFRNYRRFGSNVRILNFNPIEKP